MCGKAAVSHLAWKDIYAWASIEDIGAPTLAEPRATINDGYLKC